MSDRVKHKLFRNPAAYLGVFFIIFLFVFCYVMPFILNISPTAQSLNELFLPPSMSHIMGTDYLGRDIMARVMAGGRISLFIGGISTIISLLVGTFLGVIAGFYGSFIDHIISRIIDVMLAFPYLLIAIAIAAALTPGTFSVILALVIIGWASMARLVRSRVIIIKENDYFQAARALGMKKSRVIIKHVLPNCFSTIIIIFTLKIGAMILIESALSFLGLSGAGDIESWGALVSRGVTNIDNTIWLSIFPGAAIALTVLGFNLFGDALRDALDPKLL